MSRTKLIFIAIVMVYVAILCGVIAHWNSRSPSPKYGMFFKATQISQSQAQQEGYFTLENPDAYVLKAIKSGAMVWVNPTETTFLNQAGEHGDLYNIEHEGKYYHISIGHADPPLHPS